MFVPYHSNAASYDINVAAGSCVIFNTHIWRYHGQRVVMGVRFLASIFRLRYHYRPKHQYVHAAWSYNRLGSPVAKHNGWAPERVDDWDHGSRGWIVWVGMGLILGDCAAGLVWAICKPLIPRFQQLLRELKPTQLEPSRNQELGGHTPLLSHPMNAHNADGVDKRTVDDGWPNTSLVNPDLVTPSGAILLVIYFVTLLAGFQSFIPPPATLLAILLSKLCLDAFAWANG